eukprot:scaffold2882_cov434-Prasinococcus_capsulatus_cf.AAC.4
MSDARARSTPSSVVSCEQPEQKRRSRVLTHLDRGVPLVNSNLRFALAMRCVTDLREDAATAGLTALCTIGVSETAAPIAEHKSAPNTLLRSRVSVSVRRLGTRGNANDPEGRSPAHRLM